jgi:hypothetical protein
MIMRKGIKYHELPKYETDYIQATNISIENWDGNLTISDIYCPPRHKIKTEQYNAFINSLGHRFLVGDDFNAKHQYWGSRLINPKGRELYQTIHEKELEIPSSDEPTHWPTDINKTPDLLDFFIFKGLSHNSLDIRPDLEIASDHTPIIATNSTHIITHQNPPKLHNNKTNWETFRNEIEEILLLNIALKTAKGIEESIAEFTKVIQKAAWSATSDDKSQTKYLDYPWEVKDQIKEKRKLRRRWQKSRHPEDKRRYNEAARKLKEQI